MKRKPKKDYQITSIRLPPEVKRKVRIMAAEADVSMAEMSGKLLSLGLENFDRAKAGKTA